MCLECAHDLVGQDSIDSFLHYRRFHEDLSKFDEDRRPIPTRVGKTGEGVGLTEF